MIRFPYAALLAALLLPACVVAPADRDYDMVVAPALPLIVEFDVDPYYYHGGFFYYYQDNDHLWRYSRSRSGPWHNLPRDRYPREVRFKHRDRDGDRNRGYRYPDRD